MAVLDKHAQHCGFALSDVKELLTLRHADRACCEDVRSLAIEKKLRIEHKLRALQAMSRATSSDNTLLDSKVTILTSK